MLPLLQKNTNHEQHDFLAYTFFVVFVHIAIVLTLCTGKRSVETVLMRTHKGAYYTPVIWRHKKVLTHTPQAGKKQEAIHKKRDPIRHAYSRINLGPKKKKVKKTIPKKGTAPLAPQSVTLPERTQPVELIAHPLLLNVGADLSNDEPDELMIAVQRWWRPPVGVEDDRVCSIKVVFRADGTIGLLTIEKSSGMPAYDIAAKGALLKAVFPKKVWGKECVFHF